MRDVATLHDEAMALADEGDQARRSGDHAAARGQFERAMTLERAAAEGEPSQPSRCILFRSAAWLALEAEVPDEAERLAACGLADRDVPDRVKTELRAVAEEARLRLYQPLPPPTATSSVTLHLEGPQVGFGGAAPSDVEPRVAAVRHLLVRTAERSAGQPFRRRGPPPSPIVSQLAARVQYAPGSVVVQVTLGGEVPALWDANANLVTQVRDGLAAYGVGGEEALVPLIEHADYRENFAMLAEQLAPDGARVSAVDILAATSSGAMPLVRLRERRPRASGGAASRGDSDERELVGELRAADETGRKSIIKIEDDAGSHRVVVRDAVMEDIVRPLYGARVRARVRRRGRDDELVGRPERVDA